MNRIILVLLAGFFISCTGGLFHEINRPVSDPESSPPNVLSFLEEGIIKVVWDEDVLSDEYALYRSLDSVIRDYREVYRGTSTAFVDTNGVTGQIYHYALAKIRGLKEFEMSESVPGVFSLTIIDSFENNDTKENSTLLSSDLTANIFGYQDLAGGRFSDEDWFHVSIPPRRTAYVVLEQLNPAPSGGTDTHFDFYLEGHPPIPVINNSEITIWNDSDVLRDFRFKIFPNIGKFFPGIGAGGTIVSYRISLIRIQ